MPSIPEKIKFTWLPDYSCNHPDDPKYMAINEVKFTHTCARRHTHVHARKIYPKETASQ